MNTRWTTVSMVLIMFLFSPAFGQDEQGSTTAQIETLRQEINDLRHQLDSLKIPQSSTDQSDEMDELEQRFDARLSELENKIDAVSRSTAPIAFNPRTVAFTNFAARHDNKEVYDYSGQHEIDNRPFLRTFELELTAAVDPYADAVTVMSLENEAGKDFGVDAEEAYGLIKRLPLIEEAPLGLKIKLGKFRAPLGLDNRIHMHDLPWTTRPLAVTRYLGTEHGDFFEAGFNPVGFDADFFLPNPIPGTTLEMNIDVLRGGDIAVSAVTGMNQPAYVGHINLSKDWENISLVNFGLSTYQETGMYPARIYGADFTYKWSPVEQRESNSIVLGGEGFIVDRRDTANLNRSIHPYGWFSYLQYQSSYAVYWGARYDWVKEPFDDELLTRAASVYASYYTTEFLRLRVGFEHRWSDVPAQDNLNTILFDANFVFGSHPTEPYWVNK